MNTKKIVSLVLVMAMICGLFTTITFAADAAFKLVDMDKKASITAAGLTASTTFVNSAANSAKWVLDEKVTATFSEIQKDISKYSKISFALRLEAKAEATIMLLINSQNETTDGIDYYSKELKLKPGEWTKVELNYSDLGKSRSPRGFNDIDNLQLTATGWNNKFEPGSIIYIDTITLSGGATTITSTPAPTPPPVVDNGVIGTKVFYNSDYEDTRANLTNLNNQKKTNLIDIKKDTAAKNNYIVFESKDDNSDFHLDMSISAPTRYMVMQMDLTYTGSPLTGNIQYKDQVSKTGYIADIKNGALTLAGQEVAKLSEGKWTNVAFALDFGTNKVTAYANGKAVVKDADFGTGLTSINMLRIYFGKNAIGSNLMLDNYKVYEGKELREIKADEVPPRQSKIVTDSALAINSLGKDVVAISIGGNGIYYGGEKHAIDAPAFVKDDRTLVPVRAISEAFGLKVDWDGATQTVTIDGKSKIVIGSRDMILPDGSTYTLDVTADVYNDRTFLPLRALCEKILNKTVTWNDRGLIIIGNKTFEATDTIIEQINNYLLYDRPTPKQLVDIFNQANKNVHPRIMMTPESYDRVKYNYANDEIVKKWGDNLIASADKMLLVAMPKYELPDNYRLLATSRSVYGQSKTLSMAYVLTGDKKYADKLYEIFKAAGSFPDWNPQHFLDIGEMTAAFSIGYDWLYDAWTAEQKKFLEDTILNYGIKVAEKAYFNQLGSFGWWTPNNNTNWNVVCNGGIAMGAAAIFDKYPELCSELLQLEIRDVEAMMNTFYPDGAWFEGIGYWAYTMAYTVNMFSTLQATFGTDFNLTKAPGLAKSIYFSMAGDGPVAINNYHDAGEGHENSDTYFWLSNQFNIPGVTNVRLYNLQERGGSGTPLDILWYNTDIKGTDFYLPKDTYLKDVEFVAMRSSWVDSEGAWLSYHAGDANVNHSHLDTGSYVVDMLGERWAIDMGGDDYNMEGYFGANKHKYYRLRPEGHNLYVINPSENPGQSLTAFCKVENLVSKDRGAYSIVDLTPAYEVETSKARRGYMLTDDRRSVIVRDEITFKGQSDFYWFVHTKADIEIVDQKTAIMTQDGKRIKVMIDSDIAGYTLKVMDAVPLPMSPVMPAQNKNAGIRKLTIQGKASGSKYVQVKFVPLDDPVSEIPFENIALDKWSIPDGAMLSAPTLEMLYKDGEEMANFKPTTGGYVFTVPYDATAVPQITAKGADDVNIEIDQAKTINDVTTVKVSLKADPTLYKKYTVSVVVLPKLNDINGYTRQQVAAHIASDEPEPGHPASNVSNNDTAAESRWAADGGGQWVTLDLGAAKPVSAVGLSWWKGNERTYRFSVAVSEDGVNFEEVLTNISGSGKTDQIEIFDFPKKYNVRYVRYTGYSNSANSWNSVTEFAALNK